MLAIGLVLASSAVLAVGITVPRFPIQDFVPNMVIKQHFWTFNSHDQEMFVDVSIGGDAAKYATLSASVVKLPPRGVAEFDVVIRAPEAMPPGLNNVEVTVKERPPQGVRMAASAAATVVIQIRVPYEGKWPKATLKVYDTPEDQPILSNVTVENMGKIDISDLYADIIFYDYNKMEVGRTQSQHVPLAAHSKMSMLVPFQHQLTPGIYTAKAIVHGDENETTAEDDFILGEMDVRLLNITSTLIAGQVNPITFILFSRWSERLTGVNTVIFAGPKEAQTWRAAGPNFDLEPWQQFTKEYYMNVPAVSPGVYPGYIEVSYGGTKKRFDVQFTVKAGAEIQAPAKASVSLVGIRLLVLLVVIVIIVLFWRSRRKEKNESQT